MDEWVWSNGGMILTGENWSTGRKTLYSVAAIFNKKYSAVYKNTKYFLDNLNFLGVREICHYTQLFTCKIPSLELLLFMQYLQTSTITKHETYFNDDPVHQSRYHISLQFHFKILCDQKFECVIDAENYALTHHYKYWCQFQLSLKVVYLKNCIGLTEDTSLLFHLNCTMQFVGLNTVYSV